MKKFAIIDLGTNGFRLYIVSSMAAGHFEILHRESQELKLASAGIERIGELPFARGLAAMERFRTAIDAHSVRIIKAFGTAALRIAKNGQEFMAEVAALTDIHIELISGEREADLIFKGMQWAYPLSILPLENVSQAERIVMMDVGGGSVELIIADHSGKIWAKSYNIGVAILRHDWQQNDPISPEEVESLHRFLDETTADFLIACANFKPQKCLIACGTLDFMVHSLNAIPKSKWGIEVKYWSFSDASFDYFYQRYISLSEPDLATLPEIPADKVEMLAVSMVLMDWLRKSVGSAGVLASAHSMKTGIMLEMSGAEVE